VVMDAGRIVVRGPMDRVAVVPHHPPTGALRAARIPVDGGRRPAPAAAGQEREKENRWTWGSRANGRF
jgi:ABC-type glutathione transport system ATPase component